MAVPDDSFYHDGRGGSADQNHNGLVQNDVATRTAAVPESESTAMNTDAATFEQHTDREQEEIIKSPDGKHERPTWGGKVEFILSLIGFAVGLGNVWRFPNLCYRHGGGAFLIPYLFMLAFLGLPLFFLELAFGQYASLGPLTIWRICPLFKGVGYAMLVISFLVSIYYNALIGYILVYFFNSFRSSLPWSHCGNWWNTQACALRYHQGLNGTMDANTTITPLSDNFTTSVGNWTPRSPAQEFWEHRVLGLNDDTDIGNLGGVGWQSALCLLLSWIIVFLCVKRGIKSSGKVVYVTATLPYFMLLILFIVAVTREGAANGIVYYLKPDFNKMKDVLVWKEAAVQILYSLGVGSGALLTMGSFNKFNNNCHQDAIIVALINSGTSIFAGFVIFAILGHMSYTTGLDVSVVAAKAGAGLAFIVYPEGLAMLPGAPFWSLCFFFMLFTLGLDSQFAGIECLMTGVLDEFPRLRRHKTLVTATMCIVMFLLGLPCVTAGGMYVVDLLDKFSTAFPLLFTVLFEIIIINWIYGFRRFRDDIEHMLGFRPNYYWLACWVVISPCVVMFLLVFSCVQYDGLTLEDGYHFPRWSEGIGWLLSLTSLLMIPSWMIVRICQCIGSWQNFVWVLRGPADVSSWHLETLVTPSHEWGPGRQVDRVGRDTEIYGTLQEDTTSLPNVFFKDDNIIITESTITTDPSVIVQPSQSFAGESYI